MSLGPICPNLSDPVVHLEWKLSAEKRLNSELKEQIAILCQVIEGKCSFKEVETQLLRLGFKSPTYEKN